ncbi:MAG: D-alanyl-D-alanine carboxypeptidase [Clostridia bacterium]|nr:D-alanyl-D-alanine carboxypeptidase [Clostridia bacterium]
MKFKRLLSLLLIFVFVINVVYTPNTASADTIPAVPQSQMVFLVMDADTGHIICSSGNDNDKVYPASLTKVMTAMVALDYCSDLNKVMTISQAAIDGIGVDGQNTGRLKAGMTLDFESLLNIMMIYSANETSCAIAENIGGTIDGFIDMMNAKADSLGLTGTHYVNPCGMHDKDHYTTPLDLAKIARASLKYPIIGEIAQKSSITIDFNDGKSPVTYNSTNRLINQAHYGNYYDFTYTRDGQNYSYKVTGLKTGYTDPAGCCLITTSTSTEGRNIITVVLKAYSSLVAAQYSHKLLTYIHKNTCEYTLSTKGESYTTIPVEDGIENEVSLVYGSDLDMTILSSYFNSDKVVAKYVVPDKVTAPINAGDYIGQVQFYYGTNTTSLGSVSLVAAADVASPTPTPAPTPTATPNNGKNPKPTKVPSDTTVGQEDPEPSNLGGILIVSFVGMAFFVTVIIFINRNAKKLKSKL